MNTGIDPDSKYYRYTQIGMHPKHLCSYVQLKRGHGPICRPRKINYEAVTETSSDNAVFACSILLWTFSYTIPGIS